MSRASLRFAFAVVVGATIGGGAKAASPTTAPPQYNADVRPILADKCFRCHGPDSAARQADLRLDRRDDAVADRGGYQALVPGKPHASEVLLRIVSAEPGERMPPVDSGQSLTEDERETLKQWIAAGAVYEPHWSFVPPQQVVVPQTNSSTSVHNVVDRFVQAELERRGLEPRGEADPVTLCRRLHLDLTGLPPTPEEVDRFTTAYRSSDDAVREGAYSALVDRLLDSPRYGERMAAPWLDAARYADTNGYQTDGPRTMWRWRDWVIEAFNRNLPFDQFTIEQLAGDLLPGASLDQQIATGFHRNHRINAEGGIIAEEFLAEYVADRVETTGTVWLGLTVGCARCHDHKYDPISQQEFYELFDFFNRIPESGKGLRDENSPPVISAPTIDQRSRLLELQAALDSARRDWDEAQAEVARAEAAWAPTATRNSSRWTITEGLTQQFRFDTTLTDDVDSKAVARWDGANQAHFVPGPFAFGLSFDGKLQLDTAQVPTFDSERGFSSAVWLKPATIGQNTTVFAAMDSAMSQAGIELRLADGRPQVVLAARILDDVVRVEAKSQPSPDRWTHVAWTYDGSRSAAGVRIYVDGKLAETSVITDTLSNKFKTTEPLIVGGGGTGERFRGGVADLRLYDRTISAQDVAVVYCDLSIRALAQEYGRSRDSAAAFKIREYFLQFEAPDRIRAMRSAVADARSRLEALQRQVPTTMVMRDVPALRDTRVLLRGEYDKPGARVAADIPDAFGLPLPDAAPHDRLTLARWLVDRRNPLTARVAVNRIWQQLFGIGLVKTAEDFGVQGDWPVHHDLLDWLAVDFMDGGRGWDVKRLLKLLVTSAAYRRSSTAASEQLKVDPENRLLARGPRFRLSAEAVRDSALYVSGLLVERLGGPSVKPYQPDGLWEELGTGSVKYEQDHGDSLYRRSLYVYRKRTVSVPMLAAFDAAARETCVVRQSRTNTPLQALNLLNDTAFVEAARALGRRMMQRPERDDPSRIAFGFRLALAREPTADELRVLAAGFRRRMSMLKADPEGAAALVAIGESEVEPEVDVLRLAAFTTVGNVLLNLDEFVTRE